MNTSARIENGQIWNVKRRTVDELGRTVSGFPELASMNQLDGGNRDNAKDSTNNEKRKLTR